MGDDTRYRPGGQRMFRGKRGAARSEAACIGGVRTWSFEGEFHRLRHHHGIQRGFAGQQTRLAAVIVLVFLVIIIIFSIFALQPAQVQAGSARGQGGQPVVAETVTVRQWRASEMPHDVLVGRQQAESANCQGREPTLVLCVQMQGAGPNRFLIQKEILREAQRAETGCDRLIFLGLIFRGRTRSGPVCRMVAKALLAGAPTGTWFEHFDIGCPAGVYRRAQQQNNRCNLARTPSDFVQNKHALEQPVWWGFAVGFAATGRSLAGRS